MLKLIKPFIIIFISTAFIGCFSRSPERAVIIIDKSTRQQNIDSSHFSEDIKPKRTSVKAKKAIVRKSESIPVAGKVIKYFSKKHPGLTFDTNSAQAVRAIRDGTVVYSGNKMKSHGQMITIKHPLGFYSSYIRNQSLKVQVGDKVKKGQVIALTGKDNFYFEMKKFETLINPIKYLK